MRLFLSITTLLILSWTISASPMHLKTRSEGGDGLAIAKRASCSARARVLEKVKSRLPWNSQQPGCMLLPTGKWGPKPPIGTEISGRMLLPNDQWGAKPPIGTVISRLMFLPNQKWGHIPAYGTTMSNLMFLPNGKWGPEPSIGTRIASERIWMVYAYKKYDYQTWHKAWRELPTHLEINKDGKCCEEAYDCVKEEWQWAGPKYPGCQPPR
ncbi:hypothetical protein F5887DRAFT_966201 [Amanita rubescens]|nr:hypothetical protein F5887DRAFT_966201 [Amanita rubescens]